MVRRGSTVRVRQRALQKRRKPALFVSRELARSPTCGMEPFMVPQVQSARWKRRKSTGSARSWAGTSAHGTSPTLRFRHSISATASKQSCSPTRQGYSRLTRDLHRLATTARLAERLAQLRGKGCSRGYGALMEPSRRNQRQAGQMDQPRPICRRKCVASDRACTRVTLRKPHGKEGVGGSSPPEGFVFLPAQVRYPSSGLTAVRSSGVHRASTSVHGFDSGALRASRN
jgi:hypothetical protein